MFERFTDEARRVVVYAQEECRLREDPHIGTEHLLLGLTHGPDATSQALDDAGFDTESGRRQLETTTPVRQREMTFHIPFTPHAKRTLEASLHISDRLRQGHIAPPHVLLGLLALPDAGGVRLLSAVGVDLGALTARAEELARASAPDGADAVGRDGVPHPTAEGTTSSAQRMRQQRDRLRAALVRYGRHEDGCAGDKVCTCGLAHVLSEDVNDEGSAG